MSTKIVKAVVVVIVAVLLLGFIPDTPITGDTVILGRGGYNIKMLQAPVVKGVLLQFFSALLTKTRFGPVLRRVLLNGNGIVFIRELASQITLPPLHFPIRRVGREELFAVSPEESTSQLKAALQGGFGVELDNSNGQLLRSIPEYAEHYKAGNKPSTVIKHLLKTIREWEAEGFVIFATVLDGEVMKQAAASDERHAEGRPLSVFDGVPVAFKDMMRLKGHVLYDGAHPMSKGDWEVAEEDDLMAARFRNLGAIILGTTVMTEGGTSPLGYSSHFEGPLNPYSVGHYSGGSSSGSAVAVATGLVPIAIGFDGGGSIRLPAAMSGVHGLATSFARVPFDSKISSTMLKTGPLAASALDTALGFSVISPNAHGNFYSDMYDGGIYGPPAPHLTGFTDIESLQGVKLGVFTDWFNDADIAVRDRAKEAVAYLESLGARVVEISIPHMAQLSLAHGLKISSEFAAAWDRTHYHPSDMLEPNTRITVGIGSTVTALEVLAAEKLRAWAFEYVTDLFKEEGLAAIVSPTVGILPPVLDMETKVAGESNTALTVTVMKHIFLANLLGLPGYSVPVGFLPAEDAPGTMLPVGLHLLGDHWQEHKLLRIANALEVGFSSKLPTGTLQRVYDPFHSTAAAVQQ